MQILLNDELRDVPPNTTVAELLDDLGINNRFCAVERNRVLVNRSDHADCQLCDGDQIEIVTLVGGG